MKEKVDYQKLYSLSFEYNNPSIYRTVTRMINEANENIVDLGCGTGELWEYLPTHLQERYLGIEVNSNLVRKGLTRGRNIVCGDIFDYKYTAYDVVVLSEILEHLYGWHSFLERVLEEVQKEVIISVPFNQGRIPKIICRVCGELTDRSGHVNTGYTKMSFKNFEDDYEVDYKFVWTTVFGKFFLGFKRKYLVVRIRK